MDIPILRVPRLPRPPKLDGSIDDAEWRFAARITGFQDFRQRALTEAEIQPTWWLGYDDEHFYLAQYFPVYPKGTIKARVKQGDNGGQNPNSDDILFDDHVEIQLCDLPTRQQAVRQYFYKIVTNPYGAIIDQRTEWSVGWIGLEWESKAAVRIKTSDDGWGMEMAIPWRNLGHAQAPADGARWFAQLVSAGGADTFYSAWQPVQWLVWDLMPEVIFDAQTPVLQLLGLGDPARGRLDVRANVSVPQGQPAVEMSVRVTDPAGHAIFDQTMAASAQAPSVQLRFNPAALALDAGPHKLHLHVAQGGKIIYHAAMAFEKTSEQQRRQRFELLANNRSGAGQPHLASCYYHSYQTLTATCDVDILMIDPKIRFAPTLQARIERIELGQSPAVVLNVNASITGGGASIETKTPLLPPGEYQVVVEILDDGGAILASRADPFTVRRFAWEGNQLGMEKRVIAPFTPVRVEGDCLTVWGRSIRFGSTALPASIISQSEELLASPIRLEATIEGHDVELQSERPVRWSQQSDHNATIESHGQLSPHIGVAIVADTEYDGATFFTLTLEPRDQALIDRIDLVIPLLNLDDWEAVRSSGRDVPYGVAPPEEGIFWDSSHLPAAAGIHGTFLPYCVVSDGQRGLAWSADSDQDWLLDDAKPSFFLERANGRVCMRARLLNTRSALKRRRTIRFILTAMPTRPLPPDHRYRAWAMPNAPFSWRYGFRPAYSMWAYGTGPSINLHTQEQYDIFRERLEQDRRRVRLVAETVPGPKFLPVHSWYVATNAMGYAMPEYDTYCGEWAGLTTPQPQPQPHYVNFENEWGVWATVRQQSRCHADLTPSTVDCRVYAFDQQQKQAGMNGYWWDHSRFWTSGELIKDAAYIRDDGSVQGIYNISLMRSMMKRMAVCADINGHRPFHGYYAHGEIGPIAGFMQWLWAVEGPWYLNSAAVSLLDNIRGGLDGIRILLQKYQNLIVNMRNETTDRDSDDPWQTRSCMGVALLFDVGLGAVGGFRNPDGSLPFTIHDISDGFIGSSVNERARAKLIADLMNYDYFNADVQWTPYWRTGGLLTFTGGDIVATLYTRTFPNQIPAILLVLFNRGETDAVTVLQADTHRLLNTGDVTLRDLENLPAPALPRDGDRWTNIPIRRHDFRLLLLSERATDEPYLHH